MISSINRKRDIYDKRPEDHPAYPEEWKMFWERRYNELLEQGRDTDNHDYKTEWIPHWAKRVNEIFDKEAEEKTAELLRQYDLESPEEPKMEAFEQRRSDSRERQSKRKDHHSPTEDKRRPPREDERRRGHSRGDSRGRRERSGDAFSGLSALEEVRDRGVSPRSSRFNAGDREIDRPLRGPFESPPRHHRPPHEWEGRYNAFGRFDGPGEEFRRFDGPGEGFHDFRDGGERFRQDDPFVPDRMVDNHRHFGGGDRFQDDFDNGFDRRRRVGDDRIEWPYPSRPRSRSRSPRDSRYNRSPRRSYHEEEV
jgi:hypothetical protein